MNSRKDETKAHRIKQENQYIDIQFVEELAIRVTDDLVRWANTNIYNPLGGSLSLNIKTYGEPNARAITIWNTPYSPIIEIRLSMFQEIYRDALTFPLFSKRIEMETDTISQMHDSLPFPFDKLYMFTSGVPYISTEAKKGNLYTYSKAMIAAFDEMPHDKMKTNDIACRFVMFELIVTWIFFHELGHLVQRHYMLKTNHENSLEAEISEIDNSLNSTPDISAQAREIMADIEGTELTLQYMKRKGILQPESLYLLLCGVNCMYQRFYSSYETNLDLSSGSHPHPVIRNEFFHAYILQWMNKYLNNNKGMSALPLTYISVRSSLMSGLFWANRTEVFEVGELPTYMDLSSENHQVQKREYIRIINNEIINILPILKDIHIMPSNCLALFKEK